MSLPELNVKQHVLMDKLKAQRAASIESSLSWKSSKFFSNTPLLRFGCIRLAAQGHCLPG